MSTPIVISAPPPPPEGQLQDFSVDQAAGAVVLVLGAVASLLLVLWQSKCLCKVNLCYIFQCERRPPSEDEMVSLKDQAKKLKEKQDKEKQDKEKEDETLIPPGKSPRTPVTERATPTLELEQDVP